MGQKYLGNIMKMLAQKTGLTGKKTNHSIRKTMCTSLIQTGIPPLLVQQLSGHKNMQSLNNYSSASKEQQKQMCSILQNRKPLPSAAVGSSALALPSSEGNAADVRKAVQQSSQVAATQASTCPSQISGVMSSASTAGPFSNAVIHGGTIHVNINIQSSSNEHHFSPPPAPKRRRVMRIESDSDSD